MIVAGPGIAGSTLSDYPVISMDLYPTMLAMAGIDLKPEAHKDGLDLLPILRGERKALERTDLFWHYPHYHGSTWTPGASVRQGDWKLIQFYEFDKVELYNLVEDPISSNPVEEASSGPSEEELPACICAIGSAGLPRSVSA